MCGADIGNFDPAGFDGPGQRQGFDRIAVEKTFDGSGTFPNHWNRRSTT